MNTKLLVAAGACLIVSGCASVYSRHQSTEDQSALDDGLTYWMPKRDVIVSISLSPPDAPQAAGDAPAAPTKPGAGANPSDPGKTADPGKDTPAKAPKPAPTPVIKISASEAYADTSQVYVARFRRNAIGKNELTIEINEKGLLSSAKSKTTSDLSQIFSALAGAAGSRYATASVDNTSEAMRQECPKKLQLVNRVTVDAGTVTKGIAIPGFDHCQVSVIVTPLFDNSAMKLNSRSFGTHARRPGLFYKQNLPYEVTVTFDTWQVDDLVLLPNDSPVEFIPVEGSVFANNSSDLTFVDGAITKYGQTVDGEALTIAKLPADVIKAYFEAIGATFTSRKGATTSEKDYLDAVLALTKKQAETDACLAAYQSGDKDRITAACH